MKLLFKTHKVTLITHKDIDYHEIMTRTNTVFELTRKFFVQN